MRVFVLNKRGEPLMPCTQRKARLLLKEDKAVIYKYNPFTIQLTYATGETKQDCYIGVDTGSKHIGVAITSEDKVLFKGEIEFAIHPPTSIGGGISCLRLVKRVS